jgi:hypothetical protein
VLQPTCGPTLLQGKGQGKAQKQRNEIVPWGWEQEAKDSRKKQVSERRAAEDAARAAKVGPLHTPAQHSGDLEALLDSLPAFLACGPVLPGHKACLTNSAQCYLTPALWFARFVDRRQPTTSTWPRRQSRSSPLQKRARQRPPTPRPRPEMGPRPKPHHARQPSAAVRVCTCWLLLLLLYCCLLFHCGCSVGQATLCHRSRSPPPALQASGSLKLVRLLLAKCS